MPSSSRSNYFPDMSDYVMPSSSRSMHSPDMSDNMMPSSSRSNYFSDMSDNIMPSSSINTFSPMTHTTLSEMALSILRALMHFLILRLVLQKKFGSIYPSGFREI
jgi:hypothetical protein